jgi:hypothetical protein
MTHLFRIPEEIFHFHTDRSLAGSCSPCPIRAWNFYVLSLPPSRGAWQPDFRNDAGGDVLSSFSTL